MTLFPTSTSEDPASWEIKGGASYWVKTRSLFCERWSRERDGESGMVGRGMQPTLKALVDKVIVGFQVVD